MALHLENCCESEAERAMKDYADTLHERRIKRYAAVEAVKLPHGGIACIADLSGLSRRTVERGVAELDDLRGGDPLPGRQRAEGAGRPKKPIDSRD